MIPKATIQMQMIARISAMSHQKQRHLNNMINIKNQIIDLRLIAWMIDLAFPLQDVRIQKEDLHIKTQITMFLWAAF